MITEITADQVEKTYPAAAAEIRAQCLEAAAAYGGELRLIGCYRMELAGRGIVLRRYAADRDQLDALFRNQTTAAPFGMWIEAPIAGVH